MNVFASGAASSLLAYRLATKDVAAGQTRLLKTDPQLQRDIDHFRDASAKISSVDGLLNDRRTLGVILSSFQLEDQIDAKGLLRKLITQDPTDRKSLANGLLDPRYRKLADALHSLSDDGGATLRTQDFQDGIVAGFKTNEYEKAQGEANPAVREAMYFARSAKGISSTYQVLADRTLADVARVATGLPDAAAALDIDLQKRLVDKGVDVKRLADPKYVDGLVQKYLVLSDMNGSSQSSAATGIAALFDDGSGSASFSPVNLLA